MKVVGPEILPQLLDVMRKHWGYDTFRPLQQEAMSAALESRDSLVVLPTGGGKSLCYQAPAIVADGLTVVVSPLISLMKDQVDSLKANGILAGQLNSSQSATERRTVEECVVKGQIRLLYVSPERLVNQDFCALLNRVEVTSFVIDEAHCISHWGHDFRPEYRQLQLLKQMFPKAAIHAFTATATEDVRSDIIRQLNLRAPVVLVGNFDRPNLVYRVQSRRDVLKQAMDVVRRHPGEAGIIYCIRRKEVDELAELLRKSKLHALAYHAGMDADDRQRAQEAFAREQCDLMVATVAFGMGIDRSNVRYVLHTGMPKSLEHYQQETGRAGRDGLEAECVLLYSSADVPVWQSIMERAAGESEAEDVRFLEAARGHLEDISRYCRSAVCRHKALVEYFGQSYTAEENNCQACDVCLGETALVSDAQVIAQKIVSCVARIKAPFGVNHVASVLRGENTEAIRKWNHQQLSTFGILREFQKTELVDWIHQLYGQGLLACQRRTTAQGHAYSAIGLSAESLKLLRGESVARLYEPITSSTKDPRSKGKAADETPLDETERELFEAMRVLRRRLADERGWQPYMIFSDVTLRELARIRPSSEESMRRIYGVGATKLEAFGEQFQSLIREHAERLSLTADNFLERGGGRRNSPSTQQKVPPQSDFSVNDTSERDGSERKGSSAAGRRQAAAEMFRQGCSIDEVATGLDVKPRTAAEYLREYLSAEKPESISAWVADEKYTLIESSALRVGAKFLRPIYVDLNETIDYDTIRLVVDHLRALNKV